MSEIKRGTAKRMGISRPARVKPGMTEEQFNEMVAPPFEQVKSAFRRRFGKGQRG